MSTAVIANGADTELHESDIYILFWDHGFVFGDVCLKELKHFMQ